jgi:hypothetical protein
VKQIAYLSGRKLLWIIRRNKNNQHYALIYTTPLFYILAPTCFGSSLPSSGSFLGPPELLEMQIKWVVYHIMCGYVACVTDCHDTTVHRPHNQLFDLHFKYVTQAETKKLPDDGRLLPKHRKPVYGIKE